jgi:hypothetical protein
MIKFIKSLFGIKPTEAKAEVTEPVAAYKVETPALAVPTLVVEPTPAPVVEVVPPVVEPVVETTTTKKPAAKKPRAKKTAK